MQSEVFLGALALSRKAYFCLTVLVHPSARLSLLMHQYKQTRLPQDGFSWNLMLETYYHLSRISEYVKMWQKYRALYKNKGRDSVVVGVGTRYGLGGLGVEFGWGAIFHIRPDGPWGIPTILYKRYLVSFPGVNGQGMLLTTHPTLLRGYSFAACCRVNYTFLLLFHITWKPKYFCIFDGDLKSLYVTEQ
jgi:hypothetical protein